MNPSNQCEWVYLNNAFVKAEDATISIFDRGFLFADAVYEVIPVYADQLFHPQSHLARLKHSLDITGIKNLHTDEEWHQLFLDIHHKNHRENQAVYIQVSRGFHGLERSQKLTENPPTIVGFTIDVPAINRELKSDGITAVCIEDIRWKRCDVKTTSLVANIMMLNQARSQGADEAIICQGDTVLEATSSNIFIVKGGTVYTPNTSKALLSGVTRDFVIKTLQTLDYTVIEKPITKQQLLAADEVWLTSSIREIARVDTINNQEIGPGKKSQIWKPLAEAYIEFKQQLYSGAYNS
jgi:D-alanine transaminase